MAIVEVRRQVKEQYPYYYVKEYTYYLEGNQVAKEYYNKLGALTKSEGKIPDGPVREYYSNYTALGEWNFKNGKPEGNAKIFYESGKILRELTYKNGKREGESREYYENGTVKIECMFVNDRLEGTAKYYNNEGTLANQEFFRAGHPDLPADVERADNPHEVIRKVTETYPNGRASVISYFRNNEVIATQKLDGRGGVAEFDGRIPDGPVREYTVHGNMLSEWNFKNNHEHGLCRMFYESGSLKTEIHFNNGTRDGELRSYYESGMLQSIAHFKNGQLDKIAHYSD